MRLAGRCVSIAAVFALTAGSAAAAHKDLTGWFYSRTAINESTSGTQMKKPDFLPGTSMRSMACGLSGAPLAGVWMLVKFDRRHHIALATAHNDNCDVALFKAPPPGIAVPDVDLTRYRTGRGVHIGSTYGSVLAAYGGPRVKHGRHFVVSFGADVPAKTVTHKPVMLSEIVTLVIDDERVSSIAIEVDEAGLF